MNDTTSTIEDSFRQEISRQGAIAGHPLVQLRETASTNSDALQLGREGIPSGTVVIAHHQTGGRGRLGKQWLSHGESGLYFSLLLRPTLEPADLPKITLGAGVALCRAVSRICRIEPAIKWPNDLLISGRKCGGILTETEFIAGRPLVVLGIGLNISTPLSAFPQEIRDKTTSLARHDATIMQKRLPLLAAILGELDIMIKKMEKGAFGEILTEWKKRDYTVGKRISWLTTQGKAVRGLSLGPDSEGRLHIRDDQGMVHEVLSGDIRLQAPVPAEPAPG